jgi:hypothetical protein
MSSGLDKIRELAPVYRGELGVLRFSRALPTPVRPACHRVKDHPRSSWKSVAVAGSPRYRSGRRTISFAAAKQRPDHPRQLVGKRGNDDVERAAGEQRVDPCPKMALAAVCEPDQRSRTVHQLATQIAVATLADPTLDPRDGTPAPSPQRVQPVNAARRARYLACNPSREAGSPAR